MEKSTHTYEYSALRTELHRIRGEAGLSQRALASRLDVPHTWVAKVESGERRIDVVEFCWYALACNTDPVALLEGLMRRRKAFRANFRSKKSGSE